ncbi:zinc finger protein JACKDAW [Malania oleifera]|uniref:zinc finger protein JACKDAW n=1 Tax=Malania oleifera TaxID=397392 RepID=UPI0025AE684D|nr:zinc finger protein JACKDAW [Malania oleifera]XP_057984148.1 zinc finger protein JACKDAW [Malania oleifera]
MQMMSGDVFSNKGFPQEQDANPNLKPNTNPAAKKKRNLPGTPDPDAEVIALSPKTLMATNRFICEICNKGFQRDQNLQLHRRGHNLPWKLRQRTNKEVRKKVYICPEKTCVHHDPSRALGDLTGIKKHFSRKHGEKKWKCEKCSKKYAVQSDWKAHSKTCGTREYKCDCGTLFSRKDSFITHRAFCDALAEESARITSVAATSNNLNFRKDSSNDQTVINPPHGFSGAAGISQFSPGFGFDFAGMADQQKPRLSLWLDQANASLNPTIDVAASLNNFYFSAGFPDQMAQMASPNGIFASSLTSFGSPPELSLTPLIHGLKEEEGGKENMVETLASVYSETRNKQPSPTTPSAPMSATALLQKASQMGSTRSNSPSPFFSNRFGLLNSSFSSSSPSSPSSSHAATFTSIPLPQSVLAPAGDRTELTSAASNSSTLDELMGMQVQPITSASGKQNQNGLTRDFLGMGKGGSGGALLPQELARFGPVGSAMGLSHFSGNN